MAKKSDDPNLAPEQSEWFRELEEGRRKAFTGEGSKVSAQFQALLDQFEQMPPAQTQVSKNSKQGGISLKGVGKATLHGFDAVMRQLSRTSYAGTGLVLGGLEGKNPLSEAKKGFLLQQTESGSDRLLALEKRLKGDNFEPNKAGKVFNALQGLGADIALDPLTYAGGIGLIIKGKKAETVADAVEEAAKSTAKPAEEVGAAGARGAQEAAPAAPATPASPIEHLVARAEEKTGIPLRQDTPPGMRAYARGKNNKPIDTSGVEKVIFYGDKTAPTETAAPAVAKEEAATAPQVRKYESKLLDRSVPAGPDGLPRLTKEATAEIKKKVEKEFAAPAAGKITEAQVKAAFERAAKEGDPDAWDPVLKEAYDFKEIIKPDPELYKKFENLARQTITDPKELEAAKKARGMELATALKKKELEMEKLSEVVLPTGKAATKKTAPAVAKTEAAVAEPRLGGKWNERATQELDKAAEYTAREIQNPKFKNPYFNPAKQKNLFSRLNLAIRQNIKLTEGSDEWHKTVIAAYRVAEEKLAALGHVATDYRGNPFSIADVLEALPKGMLPTDDVVREISLAMGNKGGASAEIQAIVNKIRADSVAKQLLEAQPTVEKAADAVATAEKTLPEAQVDQLAETLPKAAKAEATAAGVSEDVADATAQAVKDSMPARTTVTKEVDQAAKVMADPKAKPDDVTEVVGKLFNEQRRYLGWKTKNHSIIFGEKFQDKILDSHMAELLFPGHLWGRVFNTSYQMSHLQPIARQYEAGAETFVRLRVEELQRLFSGPLSSPEAQTVAWESLRPGAQMTEEGRAIYEHMARWFSNKESFLSRNGLDITDLNDYISRLPGGGKWMLTKEFKDTTGVVHKLKQYDNPLEFYVKQMSSTWNLGEHYHKSPVAGVLFDLEQATEKMVAEVQAMRHFGDLFGTTRKVREGGKDWVQIDHIAFRKQKLYFPPELAAEWEKYNTLMHSWTPSSKAVQGYDKAMSLWKSGVLNYSPAYHSRNMIGDVFLSFLAGVTNPNSYRKAGKVLRLSHQRAVHAGEQTFVPFEDIADIAKTMPDSVIVRHKTLGDINADQMLLGFEKYGVAQNIATTERLGTGTDTARSLTRPFGGAVQRGTRKFSDLREDYGRMAHFIDAVGKSKAKTLDDAMREAAQEVRKYHFDYGDLTQTEIKVMRRIMPFYTWTRKSTPLLIEKFFEQPWKMATIPKANYAIAQMLGQDPQDFANPFPAGTEDLFPDWIKDSAVAPWFMHDGNFVTGGIPDPFSGSAVQQDDLFGREQGNKFQGLLGLLTPAVKIPYETVLSPDADNPNGSLLGTGIPIKDKTQYLDQQIPVANNLSRLIGGYGPVSGLESLVSNPEPGYGFKRTTSPNAPGGADNFDLVALLNQLTGLGLQENTPNRQRSAAYEQQKKARDGRR